MRLSQLEIETINRLAKKYFGEATTVSLFGSRTDDNKKGGDIDLFIQNEEKERLTLNNKIKFKVELMVVIGEQKIDVVLDCKSIRNTGFYHSIHKHAVVL